MKLSLRISSIWDRMVRLSLLPEVYMWCGLNRVRMQTIMLAVAVFSLRSIGLSQQSTPTATPAATPAVSRVQQLVMEDQSENPGNISEEDFNRHGVARRAEVRKLLAEGKIVSSEEFSDASLIFQHGQTPDDFLFAHILAVEALTRSSSADKWLTAATLDRYLQSINQPQVFGTQFTGVKSVENAPKPLVDLRLLNIQRTQLPYDSKLLSDSLREDFCVPNIAQQAKNLAILNTGHRPERKLMRAASCSQ